MDNNTPAQNTEQNAPADNNAATSVVSTGEQVQAQVQSPPVVGANSYSTPEGAPKQSEPAQEIGVNKDPTPVASSTSEQGASTSSVVVTQNLESKKADNHDAAQKVTATQTQVTQLQVMKHLTLHDDKGAPTLLLAALISAFCMVLILFVHWISPRLKALKNFNHGVVNSIAHGIVLSFIFVQAIPTLLDNRDKIVYMAKTVFLKNPHYTSFLISLCILLGLTSFYLLEKTATKHYETKTDASYIAYGSHVLLFGVLNFAISFGFPHYFGMNLPYILIFTLMMMLYVMAESFFVHEYFPELAPKNFSYIMASMLVLGWGMGLLMYGDNYIFAKSLFNGFVVGGLLMTCFKGELSFGRKFSNHNAFVISLLLHAIVTLLVVLFSNIS
jgi:hypothetical protein